MVSFTLRSLYTREENPTSHQEVAYAIEPIWNFRVIENLLPPLGFDIIWHVNKLMPYNPYRAAYIRNNRIIVKGSRSNKYLSYILVGLTKFYC